MRYEIYPPVGIGRIGNSPNGYVLPSETLGGAWTEVDTNNNVEGPVSGWKDTSYRVKRQGARFHLVEFPDNAGPPRPAQLAEGARVTWTTRLVNKKDAVRRPTQPSPTPIPVQAVQGRQDRIIDSGVQSVSGTNASRVSLAGTHRSAPVVLGSMHTDSRQRLIVLGGAGISASSDNTPLTDDFYNNPNWFDDVSDGPITAQITLPGQAPVEAIPAWVIFAPPDFAPVATGVVTLYDVMLQVAITAGWRPAIGVPSFELHIRPLLARTASLQWVHSNSTWSKVSQDWGRLADPSPANKAFRQANETRVKAAETFLRQFQLREFQEATLQSWVNGNFDTTPAQMSHTDAVTRAILDTTVGQGFFPGIEAGIIVTNPAIYAQPFNFRFDHSKLTAGDLTALMAQPWQSDFLKCAGGWWPSQRPDSIPTAAGPRPDWSRPFSVGDDHIELVNHCMKLGVIAEDNGTIREMGRDPSLPA